MIVGLVRLDDLIKRLAVERRLRERVLRCEAGLLRGPLGQNLAWDSIGKSQHPRVPDRQQQSATICTRCQSVCDIWDSWDIRLGQNQVLGQGQLSRLHHCVLLRGRRGRRNLPPSVNPNSFPAFRLNARKRSRAP